MGTDSLTGRRRGTRAAVDPKRTDRLHGAPPYTSPVIPAVLLLPVLAFLLSAPLTAALDILAMLERFTGRTAVAEGEPGGGGNPERMR